MTCAVDLSNRFGKAGFADSSSCASDMPDYAAVFVIRPCWNSMSPYFSYGVSKMKLVFQIHFPKTGFSEMLPLHSGKGENRSCATWHRQGRRQRIVNNSYNSFLGEVAHPPFFPKRSRDSTAHKHHSVCTAHPECEPSNNNGASIFGQQRNRRNPPYP